MRKTVEFALIRNSVMEKFPGVLVECYLGRQQFMLCFYKKKGK